MSNRKRPEIHATGRAASTVLVFAPPIMLGALLLFAVQPLIARYLLPWFGGGPGVWTTCMLFFQALLLGGYFYAHVSVRLLNIRGQTILHLALLAGSLLLIPFVPSDRWKPTSGDDPSLRILLLLAATIGLPYFVLSATSPLLQAWFVKVKPNVSPYRLFALSNLGSLLALLGYPTILEPFFTRRQQAWAWSAGLLLFALTCIVCCVQIWKHRPQIEPSSTAPEDDSRGRKPAVASLLWLALPLVASIALLAITNTLTEDVAVTPLLWIVPLALYLVTFIIAFDSPRWYPRQAILILLSLATLWMLRIQWLKPNVSLFEQFAGYLAGMFLVCLFCHGELARLKPHPSRLTSYYLLISLGGALGGVFVAILAPRIFNQFFELPLAVLAAAALSFACLKYAPMPNGHRWAALFTGTALAFLLGEPVLKLAFNAAGAKVIDRSRNFYGTLVVAELDAGDKGDPIDRALVLNHGSTSHGQQFLTPERRKEPTLYYRVGSGVSYAMHFFPRAESRKIGLVGLGVGTLAAYGRPGDTFRFYEIDPAVEHMARKHFTFLADSPASIEVALADARLTLEHESPQNFDILVLDAFSSDAIPTHLLTAEAFDIYRRHVASDGIIAVHISNRSVDLIQPIVRQAERLQLPYSIINHQPDAAGPLISRWILLTNNNQFLSHPAVHHVVRVVHPNPAIKLWTDDHVNLLSVIRWISKATTP
jgi:hypothetical protein